MQEYIITIVPFIQSYSFDMQEAGILCTKKKQFINYIYTYQTSDLFSLGKEECNLLIIMLDKLIK